MSEKPEGGPGSKIVEQTSTQPSPEKPSTHAEIRYANPASFLLGELGSNDQEKSRVAGLLSREKGKAVLGAEEFPAREAKEAEYLASLAELDRQAGVIKEALREMMSGGFEKARTIIADLRSQAEKSLAEAGDRVQKELAEINKTPESEERQAKIDQALAPVRVAEKRVNYLKDVEANLLAGG